MSEDDLAQASSGNMGFVVKGFSNGYLDRYQDMDFLIDSFANDNYTFLTSPRHLSEYETLPLPDGLRRMRDEETVYLSFADQLIPNNPSIENDIHHLFDHSPRIGSMVDYKVIKQSFLSYGTQFRTALHVAPVSDWFIQIAGSKRWRLVLPQYTPYMMPYAGPMWPIYYGARFFIFDDSSVPFTDVVTEPGDLMFFPPHWWHEVHNLDPDFGFGVALRPTSDVKRTIASTLFPFMATHENLPMRAGVTAAIGNKLFHESSYPEDNENGNQGGNYVRQKALDKIFENADQSYLRQFIKFYGEISDYIAVIGPAGKSPPILPLPHQHSITGATVLTALTDSEDRACFAAPTPSLHVSSALTF